MKQFQANLVASLIFFRRNRLVVLVGLLLCFMWGATLIPSLIFMSASDKFTLIRSMLEQSQGFVLVFVAVMAVMAVAYNINNRCLKMVVTKPCPPEMWLLAHYAAVLLVALVLQALILAAGIVLFKVWHIPMQWGVFYLFAESFLRIVTVVSILSFLVSVMHPLLAIVLMTLANEGTFYGLLILLSAVLTGATGHVKMLYNIANVAVYALYLVVPSYSPFERQVQVIHSSLRMGWGDVKWLGLTLIYTVLVTALFYTLTAIVLRRRRLT